MIYDIRKAKANDLVTCINCHIYHTFTPSTCIIPAAILSTAPILVNPIFTLCTKCNILVKDIVIGQDLSAVIEYNDTALPNRKVSMTVWRMSNNKSSSVTATQVAARAPRVPAGIPSGPLISKPASSPPNSAKVTETAGAIKELVDAVLETFIDSNTMPGAMKYSIQLEYDILRRVKELKL